MLRFGRCRKPQRLFAAKFWARSQMLESWRSKRRQSLPPVPFAIAFLMMSTFASCLAADETAWSWRVIPCWLPMSLSADAPRVAQTARASPVRFGIVPDVAEAHLPKMTSLRRHHQKTTCETVVNPVRHVLAYRLPTHNGRPVRDHPPTGFDFLLKCQRRWFSLLLCNTPKFNAACFSLGHQPCSQGGADDEAEHRTKYNEPDRRNYDGRLMRFRHYLCLHILSSAEPELIKNAQDRERQSAKHKDNSFDAVVPNDRCVVYDFGIATKQLIASAVNENADAN
jgi:hypothetical protein